MSGISFNYRDKYQVDKQLINTLLATVNTILVGDVTAVSGTTVTVQPTNKLTTQDRYGNINSVTYPPITTNFITPSLFQYTPDIGDTIILFVSQSNIQDFLNGGLSETLSNFNLLDSVVFPIRKGYSDSTKIIIGKSSKDLTIQANNFEVDSTIKSTINCAKLQITNTTADLIPNLITVLNDIAAVPINDSIGNNTIGARAPGIATIVSLLMSFN